MRNRWNSLKWYLQDCQAHAFYKYLKADLI